ncbi:MAG: exosortase A [Rhodospirillaceae bacterium]
MSGSHATVNSDDPALMTTGAPDWRSATLWFGMLVTLALLLFHDAAITMVGTWWDTKTYNHGFLVLPITLGLIWGERKAVLALVPKPEPRALVGLAVAGLLWLVGQAIEATILREVALVGLVIALVPLVFGWPVCRRLWFPLAFLWFMVPAGDELIPALQSFTSTFASALVGLAGVPVFHDGILIQTPGGMFEVAEACAGIRFLIANVALAVLFSYFAFQIWWKSAIMLCLAVVVPVVANGVRAATIILIANWIKPEWASGFDHVAYGWGFFAVVMFLLLWLGSHFADPPPLEQLMPADPPVATCSSRQSFWRWWPAAVAAVMIPVAPAYAHWVIRSPVMAASAGVEPISIPGWRQMASVQDWQPSFPGADRTILASYRGERGIVHLFVAFYDYQRQGAKVVSFANRFDDGRQWRRVATEQDEHAARLAGVSPRLDRLVANNDHGQRVVLWWYWVANRFTSDPARAKLFQLQAALWTEQPAAAVLAIASDIGPNEPMAAGLPRLTAFLDALGDPGGWLDRLAAARRGENGQ